MFGFIQKSLCHLSNSLTCEPIICCQSVLQHWQVFLIPHHKECSLIYCNSTYKCVDELLNNHHNIFPLVYSSGSNSMVGCLNKVCISIWEVLCQKQVSRVGTSNYIPQKLWDVITCPCPWCLLLAYHSSCYTF